MDGKSTQEFEDASDFLFFFHAKNHRVKQMDKSGNDKDRFLIKIMHAKSILVNAWLIFIKKKFG